MSPVGSLSRASPLPHWIGCRLICLCDYHQIRVRLDVSKRAYNFCAGPAALPEAVLQRAQGELLDWHGKGLSVMEMSHRSDEFVSIATKDRKSTRLNSSHLGISY